MPHRSFGAAILLLALIITGVSPGFAGLPARGSVDPRLAELERTVGSELTATGTPGAAVVIVQGDKVIFAKGFGRTSVEGGLDVSPDTLFRIGSTTKMFTAAAFAALAGQSKVRFDTPVGSYLPGLPPKVSRLTGHQILSQSSGLRDMNTDVVSDDDNALARNVALWKDDAFFTEPDTIYSYPDAMHDLIFAPLGIKRTFFRPREAMTFPLALGHNRQGTTHTVNRPAANNAAIYPGGSIFSSVNELSNWLIAMLNGGKVNGKQALQRSVVENLLKRQFDLPGGDAYYSYGLLGYDIGGVKTISHGGVSRGYGATLFFAPEQKFAYAVLTNSNGQTLPSSRQKLNELFLPIKPDSDSQAAASTNRDLDRFVGRFEHAPQSWVFTARDGKLYVTTEGKEHELQAEGPDTFSYSGGPIKFVPNSKGEYQHIFMGLYAARKKN